MILTLSPEDTDAIAEKVSGLLAQKASEMLCSQASIKPRGMTEKAAAEYLGYKVQAIRKSRVTGELGTGIPAPPWKKAGAHVLYDKEQLDKWLDKLPTYDPEQWPKSGKYTGEGLRKRQERRRKLSCA